MTFTRCLHYIAIGLLWSMPIATLPANAATGVAFVHGTGSQSDAFNDYWTADFVESVTEGLPDQNNFVVVNCDFELFMFEEGAAGCLADQLLEFINTNAIDDLVVITHSNGGNVMRWILSNPTIDGRYPPIIAAVRQVTAIAPSSLGTPLADAVINGNVFEQVLGWLLGFANDAVRMQRVADMAYYNENFLLGTSGRPALPVPFRTLVGSDVDSSPFDSDSYCGGLESQVALEFTQNWLNDCSDGFLDCASQEGAGELWLRDASFTDGSEPLSHQQSRRDCFGLDTLLRDDL